MFKNLEQRLLEQEQEIYNRLSAKVGHDGTTHDEPFQEFKPHDTNLPTLQLDTQFVPGQASEIDGRRLESFLNSGRGMLFVDRQMALQKRNAIFETSVYNEDSIRGANVPLHFTPRVTAIPSELDPRGSGEGRSSATMGRAGRMQASTAQEATIHIPFHDIRQWSGNRSRPRIASTDLVNEPKELGALGINQRPEFDMDGSGEYKSLYSVELWKYTIKNSDGPLESSFKRLGNAVKNIHPTSALNTVGGIAGRVTNIAGSIANNVNRIGQFVNDAVSFGKDLLNPVARRDRGFVDLAGSAFNLINQGNSIKLGMDNTEKPEGLRYFITDDTDADRYISRSIDHNGKRPIPSLNFVHRPPMPYEGRIWSAETSHPRGGDEYSGADFSDLATPQSQKRGNSILDQIQKGIDWISNTANSVVKIGRKVSHAVDQIKIKSYEGIENPSEDAMKYSGLSLRQRYLTEDETVLTRQNIDFQNEQWMKSIDLVIKDFSQSHNAGYRGGITPGTEIIINKNDKFKFPAIEPDDNGVRRYFSDPVNTQPIAKVEGEGISYQTLSKNQTGLINFYFFDYVNKKSIPMRAYLADINHTITPSFTEMPYIGRAERYVVYTGFRRDLAFRMQMYAMSPEEMNIIYKKINYLISLNAPSMYEANGFMVPPLVKLTIGSLFVNQPGYIKAMTVSVDNDTPWEVDYDMQVPMGISINITYTILETHQMRAGMYDDKSGHSPTRYLAPLMGRQVGPNLSYTKEEMDQIGNTVIAIQPNVTPGANRTSDIPLRDTLMGIPTAAEEEIRRQVNVAVGDVLGSGLPSTSVGQAASNRTDYEWSQNGSGVELPTGTGNQSSGTEAIDYWLLSGRTIP